MVEPKLPDVSPFSPHDNADLRIASAINAVRAILSAELLPEHKRELLSVCLWKLSLAECRGKYDTRYVSLGALRQPEKVLAHEHVNERSKLVRDLIAGAIGIESLRDLVVACTVLRTEHAVLSKSGRAGLSGWERYRDAKIGVIDREKKAWLIAP